MNLDAEPREGRGLRDERAAVASGLERLGDLDVMDLWRAMNWSRVMP